MLPFADDLAPITADDADLGLDVQWLGARRDLVVRAYEAPLSRPTHLRAWLGVIRDLRNRHGLAVPPFSLVVGHAGDTPRREPVVYVVARRVAGRPLGHALKERPAAAARAAGQACVAFARHYRSVAQAGGSYAVDVRAERLVLDDNTERAWWVGLAPVLAAYEPGDWLETARLCRSISDVLNLVVLAEAGAGIRLVAARTAVEEALDAVVSREPEAAEWVRQMRAGLAEQRPVFGNAWVRAVLHARRSPSA